MKSILLIAPECYGYELYIKRELVKRGYQVYLIYENISNVDMVYRIISNYFKKYEERYVYKYYVKHISDIRNSVDRVIVIRGSSLRKNIIELIDEKFPGCFKVMYQWDSTQNNKHVLEICKEFDRVLTFDKNDAEKYGWLYRPLFFIENLCTKKKKKYDFAFICTLHSQRVEIVKRLVKIADKMKYKGFMHVFTTITTHLRHKYLLKDPAFTHSEQIKVKHYALSLEKTNDIYSASRIIIDYTHPSQSGYTMRTIESVGHKCKLVTNNKNIFNADFYNPENILVYEGREIDLPEKFIKSPYTDIAENIYQAYSLAAFIDELLCG